MNGWPPKHTRDDFFISVNIDPHRRCDHMIRTTVAGDINIAFFSNVIYKPGNFVSVGFNHNFELGIRVNHPDGRTIIVGEMMIHKRLDIIQPNLLARSFKPSRRSIVEVGVEELLLFSHLVYIHSPWLLYQP